MSIILVVQEYVCAFSYLVKEVIIVTEPEVLWILGQR
jgi:hypothetical protein